MRIEDRIDAFVRDITLIIRNHAQLAVRQALAERRRALAGESGAQSDAQDAEPDAPAETPQAETASEAAPTLSAGKRKGRGQRGRRRAASRGSKAKQLSLF